MALSIKVRLAAAFFGLAMLSGLQGALSISNASHMKADVAEFEESDLSGILVANRLLDAASEVRIKQYRIFGLAGTDDEVQSNIKQYLEALRVMARAIKSYEALVDEDAERDVFQAFLADWAQYQQISDEAFKILTVANKPGDALISIASRRPLFDKIRGELNGLIEINNNQSLRLMAHSNAAAVATIKSAWACSIAAVCAALMMMILSYKYISLPILRLTNVMKDLSSGNIPLSVPYLGRRDEIASMAKAVEVFKANMIQNRQLETENSSSRSKLAAERRNVMLELADRFECTVSGVVTNTAKRAGDMRVTASELADAATETASRSATVALASKATEESALSTANAAHGLGQSVDIVQNQVDGSASLAKISEEESRQAEASITDLLHSASKIGVIVSMISSIAGQTNLLALNATIEAARAGDGGRGFVVVAQEVKGLADQTAAATAEIAGQIGRIQASTQEAVAAIHRIGHRITQMSEAAAAIVAAVNDQKVATRDIVQSIKAAASNTQQVTGNISHVADTANATGAAAKRVLETASELAGQSQFLRTEVERFLNEVRAA